MGERETDRLAEIEAREVATGPRFLTLWEQSALVEIARAAHDVDWQVGQRRGYENEHPSLARLHEALARLDSGAAERDA